MSATEACLREWAPLSDLSARLPGKSPVGIFFHDVRLTCVDVLPDFIALGTNVGLVYWYDRKSKGLQRLKCENSSSPVTVVKALSTVDYMVACGSADGSVTIFEIPKICPDFIPDRLKPKNKQVERYTVADLHKISISALEWSKNGMKLFSGDKNGVVVFTELDFAMHLCKSVEILNEAYEVVQLSYFQQNLLISTTYRSIICQNLDKEKVAQIGRKDRKVLGRFGGIFYKNGLGATDAVIYCTRPGLRLWVSDLQGCVQKTLLFKELLNRECAEVPLINPVAENVRKSKPPKETSFGVLLRFSQDFLVTHGGDVVYILDPKEMRVICCVKGLRNVLGVATNKDEIFILEGERNLIRVAYRPENFPEIPIVQNLANPISTSIRELTTKLQATGFMSQSVEGEFSVHTDATAIIDAEEAVEESPETSCSESLNYQRKLDVYNKIGRRDFEETILFKHHRRKKKKNVIPTSASVNSLSSSGSDEKDSMFTKATLMNLSTVGVLPDLRSPESIKNDIAYKEKILANVLNFDKSDSVVAESKQETPKILEEEEEKQGKEEVNENCEDICEEIEAENKEEFSIKPFKHIFPEFDKLKYEDLKTTEAPACVSIPTDWKLSTIKLQNDALDVSLASDDSLQEWEII